ncbi:MAG: pyridoxamine 5'-phosphate oxidase family protein [Clostridiales bacterium]|nr:pyridoxamine 5'-phosphate oxidase family protein [Clostridiales bacterium]
MKKQEIYDFMNQNVGFYLATMDGNQPRVRGMMLFKADENGIVFHTASTKDVYKQILKNPKAELCFNANGIQIRVTGVLEIVHNEKLREEIFNHPSRKFLQAWKDKGIDNSLEILVMRNCEALIWTMQSNFDAKEPIRICEKKG